MGRKALDIRALFVFTQTMLVILHADLNSFFASVEQQENPTLRGQPVGILKAAGRSCVIACSDEAKTQGVATGMSLTDVESLCPEIILVPANFDRYFFYTRQFLDLVSRYTDRVEVFSLDEVFLDLTHTHRLYSPQEVARDIQRRVSLELGEALGCSIGIAKNKLLAKLASNLAPRKGILEITEQNQARLLAQAPFDAVCGIGYRLTARLHALGIYSLPQIAATPDRLLDAAFGPFWGPRLKQIARGEDYSPVVTLKELGDAKSVSRTFTLFADTTNPRQIKGVLRNLVEEAAFKLRQMGLTGRQFGLSLRGGGRARVGHVTGKTFTDSGRDIFDRVYTIYSSWRWRYPVRFLGVWVGLLAVKDNLSLPLFTAEQRSQRLTEAIDRVNLTYGDYAVHPASLLFGQIVKPEANGYLGDKKFQFRGSL
ncbi:TPA: hypothetical protein DCK82_03535 [Candidatus Beckwithbacteria bacterium]|nr:hypothetical protein [Candidatus Beckwithbacteria bacterium]